MQFLFTLLLGILISCSHSTPRTPAAIPKQTSDSITQEFRDFLIQLGYRNYVAMMVKSEDDGLLISKISEKVLAEQKKHYQIFNLARELSVELLLSLYENNDSNGSYFILGKNIKEAQNDLVNFTAKMISFKPYRLPQRPKDFDKLKSEDQIKWLKEATNQNIAKHVKNVMADVTEVLYDNDKILPLAEVSTANPENAKWKPHLERLKKLRLLTTGIIQFSYLNNEMGKTPYLGKALAAAIWKYSLKENQKNIFTDNLRFALWKEGKGLHLLNYVGDTLVLNDKHGRSREIRLENGDFVYQRAIGPEINEITSSARPAEVNEYFAQRFDLLSTPLTVVTPPQEETQRQENFPLWFKSKITKTGFADRGLSHVGIAVKNVDPTTGISMVWAVDNHPNSGEGGIRIVDIVSQFARPSDSLRFGIHRYDPTRFYQFANKYFTRNKFRENVWESDEEDRRQPAEKVDKEFWKATHTETDYLKLFSENQTATNHSEWHSRFMKKITDHMVDYMLARGMGFSNGLRNTIGRGYCSSTILIASLQATGIDLQSFHDRWHPLVLKGKEKNAKFTEWLDPNQRIIAPAGFMWQGDLVDESSMAIVQYPYFSNYQRMDLNFSEDYRTLNPKTAQKLNSNEAFEKLTTATREDRLHLEESLETAEQSILATYKRNQFLRENPNLGDEYRSLSYVGYAASLIQDTPTK